jgi:hypothetical protein
MVKKSRAANRKHWEKLMAKFDSSNMSVTAFCKRQKVSAPTFYNWRRKLADQGGTMVIEEDEYDEDLLDETEDAESSEATACMELPGGVLMRVPIDRVGQVVSQLVGLR